MEAFLQPFHLASGLEYVASGAYLAQPSFQRYVQQPRGAHPVGRRQRGVVAGQAD